MAMLNENIAGMETKKAPSFARQWSFLDTQVQISMGLS